MLLEPDYNWKKKALQNRDNSRPEWRRNKAEEDLLINTRRDVSMEFMKIKKNTT